ncbi:MAG: NUDIX domain-containing protein [Methanosphaera sp.]|nr:NUDIX domain-containing protein [Methanosphaera sp.]
MKKEKSCGAVVINSNNEVLLVYHNTGHISFPKGHMEKGENEIDTACREVFEETGIKIEINKNIKYVSTCSPKQNVIKDVVFFKAKPINNELKAQLEEVSKVEFVDIDKAFDIITYKNDKQILKNIIERSDKDEY